MRAGHPLVSIARMRSTPAPIGWPQDARHRLWQIVVVTLTAALPCGAHAAGTAAGTTIQNTATVSFSVAGTPASTNSNATSVTVAEILNVTVTLQSPTVATVAGATNKALVFRVTNTGNSNETFTLAGLSALVGDDFDPVPATPFLYIDTDGSGDLSAADAPYVAGSNDPTLAADANVGVIVLNNIPAGLADGTRGRSQLHAAARTGTGAPGTVFAGQGTGGVDAIAGTSGGQAQIYGEYLVGAVNISAVKSQTVTNTFRQQRARARRDHRVPRRRDDHRHRHCRRRRVPRRDPREHDLRGRQLEAQRHDADGRRRMPTPARTSWRPRPPSRWRSAISRPPPALRPSNSQ